MSLTSDELEGQLAPWSWRLFEPNMVGCVCHLADERAVGSWRAHVWRPRREDGSRWFL